MLKTHAKVYHSLLTNKCNLSWKILDIFRTLDVCRWYAVYASCMHCLHYLNYYRTFLKLLVNLDLRAARLPTPENPVSGPRVTRPYVVCRFAIYTWIWASTRLGSPFMWKPEWIFGTLSFYLYVCLPGFRPHWLTTDTVVEYVSLPVDRSCACSTGDME